MYCITVVSLIVMVLKQATHANESDEVERLIKRISCLGKQPCYIRFN